MLVVNFFAILVGHTLHHPFLRPGFGSLVRLLRFLLDGVSVPGVAGQQTRVLQFRFLLPVFRALRRCGFVGACQAFFSCLRSVFHAVFSH